jgi:hypothetical protein
MAERGRVMPQDQTEKAKITKAERQRRATLDGSRPFGEVEEEWIAKGSPVVPPKIICRVCGAAAIKGADLRRVDPGVFECRASHSAAAASA